MHCVKASVEGELDPGQKRRAEPAAPPSQERDRHDVLPDPDVQDEVPPDVDLGIMDDTAGMPFSDDLRSQSSISTLGHIFDTADPEHAPGADNAQSCVETLVTRMDLIPRT